MKRLLAITCSFILMMLIGQLGFAQIPRTLFYQGILTDSLGTPKPDGDYALTFRLWDTESGGSFLWKEAKTLPVKKGLFSTGLGDETPFPSAVRFDKPYWLSIQLVPEPEMAPRLPLSSVAYSMNSVATDSARIAGTVTNNGISTGKLADGAVTSAKILDGTIQRADVASGFSFPRADTASFAQLAGNVPDNAITSAKILNGTIQFADLGQNGAGEGQILKWTGGTWAAAADATGGGGGGTIDSARIAGTVPDNAITSAKIANGTIQFADLAQNGAADGQVIKWSGSTWTPAADAAGGASGWADNGSVVGLTTATDTVALNTTARLGKLNLNGDIGLNGESGLYFGTRNSYLEATPGENLTLRANNDLKTYAGGGLTMLAADNINLGHLGEASWMKLDNTNKRVGIGMGTTDAVDDRLHVKNDLASNCWARIESAHPSSWGQAGLRIKTPQNTWHLRMDANGNANFPDGALSLYNSGGGAFETMTWLKDGKVGIGTKNPIRRLHVNGSAEIEDTLYAGTVKATNMIGGPGLVHSKIGWNEATKSIGSNTWVTFDSVTIQAPGPGYVLLLLSASLETNHTFYYDDTHVRMAIAKTRTGGDKLGYCDWAVPLDLPSAYYKTPAALNAVAFVASAGSYEYFAGGHNWLGADDQVFWTESFFTALFIPASYGVVEAAPHDPPPPGDATATAGRQRTTPESFESRLNALTSELEALKREQASRGQ